MAKKPVVADGQNALGISLNFGASMFDDYTFTAQCVHTIHRDSLSGQPLILFSYSQDDQMFNRSVAVSDSGQDAEIMRSVVEDYDQIGAIPLQLRPRLTITFSRSGAAGIIPVYTIKDVFIRSDEWPQWVQRPREFAMLRQTMGDWFAPDADGNWPSRQDTYERLRAYELCIHRGWAQYTNLDPLDTKQMEAIHRWYPDYEDPLPVVPYHGDE